MILQNILRRDVGDGLTDISLSNIFVTMPFPAGFHQTYQAVFASVGINKLILTLHCFCLKQSGDQVRSGTPCPRNSTSLKAIYKQFCL